jgi:uncharacterized protein YraI
MRRRNRFLFVVALTASLALPLAFEPSSVAALSCGPCPATTTADLNLRAGPSLADAVLRVIPAGAGLEWDNFRDQVNGFVPVAYDGTSGWAHRDYLILYPAAATTTASLNLRSAPSLGAPVLEVMPPGAPVMVLGGPDNGYYSVRYQERVSGWAAGAYLDFQSVGGPDPGFSIGQQVVVDTDFLNYRTGPSITASVIRVFPGGTQGAVTDGPVSADGYVWYEFSTAGYGPDGATPGWVAGEFLAPI